VTVFLPVTANKIHRQLHRAVWWKGTTDKLHTAVLLERQLYGWLQNTFGRLLDSACPCREHQQPSGKETWLGSNTM